MAGSLSSAIDSSDDYAAETRNAMYPSMSALTTVSKVYEIDSLLTNSQQELILHCRISTSRRLHKHQNSITFTTVKFTLTSEMFINNL